MMNLESHSGNTGAVPQPTVAPGLIVAPAPKERWALVRNYAALAGKFERARLACQVMAGFELIALQREYISDARRRREAAAEAILLPAQQVRANSPILGENAKMPTKGAFSEVSPAGRENSHLSQWRRVLEAESKLAPTTAERWMAMARACRPRLKKLQGEDRLRALLEIPPSQWSEDDTALVDKAVRKLTDGQTQLEFMYELGLVKLPPGHGAKGGYHPRLPGPATIDEQIAAARHLAEKDWPECAKLLDAYGAKFMLLDDLAVNCQISLLEIMVRARRQWISEPPGRRPAVQIEDALKRLAQ